MASRAHDTLDNIRDHKVAYKVVRVPTYYTLTICLSPVYASKPFRICYCIPNILSVQSQIREKPIHLFLRNRMRGSLISIIRMRRARLCHIPVANLPNSESYLDFSCESRETHDFIATSHDFRVRKDVRVPTYH